jgi:hypothetical protein
MTTDEAILTIRQLLVSNNQYSHQLSDTLKQLAAEAVGVLELALHPIAPGTEVAAEVDAVTTQTDTE